MKRIYIFMLLAAAFMAGCSHNNSGKQESAASKSTTAFTYEGVIPAADSNGIRYTVTMTPSSADDGTFVMEQTPVEKSARSFSSKGIYEEFTDTVTTPGRKYYRLISAVGSDTTYLVVTSDKTVILTDASLMPAPSGLDYTLTLKGGR